MTANPSLATALTIVRARIADEALGHEGDQALLDAALILSAHVPSLSVAAGTPLDRLEKLLAIERQVHYEEREAASDRGVTRLRTRAALQAFVRTQVAAACPREWCPQYRVSAGVLQMLEMNPDGGAHAEA